MRTEEEIIAMLLSVAEEDIRIRGVILNGSRTNPDIKKDRFQDFDVIYLVEDIESYREDLNWINVFGERIIMQMPYSMQLDEEAADTKEERITYLMLFKDLNRIDLNLVDVKNMESCQDSLNKILLDKDGLFDSIPEPSDRDYLVKKPSQQQFSDCCNEFWWVSTYVVKGLVREEPLYAKDMLEGPVRKMFMKMLAWKVGVENDFSVNLGKSNRFLKRYVHSSFWEDILKTYPDAGLMNIWKSLLLMTQLFHQTGIEVARALDYHYHLEEAKNVEAYIRMMWDEK